jgi:large subunit ribosomal protein L5
MSKLKEEYNKSIRPKLMKELELANVHSVPTLKKIIVNVGVGEAVANPKAIEVVSDMLTNITGQKAVVTKAKKAISNFKIRQGMAIGAMVTLRGENMWYFYEKLVNIIIPRIKDFRGLNLNSFDGAGNYTLGIKDHTIFPEIDPNEIDRVRSLEITIVTGSEDKEASKKLLLELGLPLKKQ